MGLSTFLSRSPGDPVASWRAPVVLGGKILLGVLVGGWVLLQGPMQAFLAAVRESTHPGLRPHVDALLVPYWAAFVSAALAGLAVSSAGSVRSLPPTCRARAAWTCVFIGLLLAGLLHGLVAYGLPMTSRHLLFGASRAAGFAADYPPYLLTNDELASVQTYFRQQGGYSSRLALMWHVRAWAVLQVPVFGLLAGAAIARAGRGRALHWFFGLQAGVATLWVVGSMIAVGPAAFSRPSATPQNVAWVLLVAVGVAAVLSFRTGLQALEAEDLARVLAELESGR